MLVRKKARACGIVLYGVVLGLVLALPGCNANWPSPGSKEEANLLGQYHPGEGNKTANDLCSLASKLVISCRTLLASVGWAESTTEIANCS
jgi:hypothetical protein